MSTRPLLIAMVLGLVFWVSQPVGAHAASCTGVCNPDTDECCKDDCTYEDQDATCIPFNHGETCRTKKCDYVGGNPPTCTKGSFSNLPTDTDCIGTDPCAHGTCNSSGVCINQTNNPCEDGNQCTDNTCTASGTQGFTCTVTNKPNTTSCTVNNPDSCKNYTCDGNGVCAATGNKTDGTPCAAFPSGTTCQVRSCASGVCNGTPVGSPVSCVVGSCQNPNCTFDGVSAHCVPTNKLKGTVCDTDPWDCTHQRCDGSSPSVCKGYKTTTLKECDADTTTASHCKLSYCDSHKHCRTDAAYIHYFGADIDDNTFGHGTWQVEDAATTGRSNRVLTPQFQCPQTDGNICTSDRCVGSQTDSCHFYGCDVGDACPFPPCGDVCDNVTDPNTQVTTCTCRFN